MDLSEQASAPASLRAPAGVSSDSQLLRPPNAWLAPRREFDLRDPEFIDQPAADPGLIEQDLRLLQIMNRRTGNLELVLASVEEFAAFSEGRSLAVLDLGTGSADIPRALVKWARQRGLPITVTAVDRNPQVLTIAREACADWPEIRIEEQDFRTLPWAPESFDIVLCSLALHHLATPDAERLLARMHSLTRVGYLVSDLRRNHLAIWLVEILSRTLSRSPALRHDGPKSARAAFTIGELTQLARRAGLSRFVIRRHNLCFQLALAGWKNGNGTA